LEFCSGLEVIGRHWCCLHVSNVYMNVPDVNIYFQIILEAR
jgi:hypothetical protein